MEGIDCIAAGDVRDFNLVSLDDPCDTMAEGSLCAMGELMPYPVRSALYKQKNRCENE